MTDDATRAQQQAATPDLSVWLAANAGSGKTKVLTDRVARLLLGGTQPQRILCLTYTKAAASEMQNRLFRRLGDWAMKDEAALRAALADLGPDHPVDDEMLARARRLFARAIETPGGLKIQTIHSFCAGLLRRFPVEAGVSPDFTELDDRSAAHLRREIIEELAAGPDLAPVDALASLTQADDPGEILGEICRNSDGFAGQPPDPSGGRTEQDVLAGAYVGGEEDLIGALVPLLMASGSNDRKAGAKLAAFRADAGGLKLLEDLLLYKSGARAFCPKDDFPTKGLSTGKAAPLMPALEALKARVAATRDLRLSVQAADRNRALYRFARSFLPLYQARKQAAGYLDFDDLIRRAAALLADPAVAAWVLFRLDGGIDHILVDEAQDTSPGQWQVIKALSEEFTAGQGARAEARRIFVVGDKKQSIYSFQGADLATFDATLAELKARHRGAAVPFGELELQYSFRSSTAILNLVDLTFDERVQRGLGGPTKHHAFWPDMPGRVDLWPLITKTEKPEDEAWENPVDLATDSHHTVILARAIAAEIRLMIDQGTRISPRGVARPVHEGDILILLRRRSGLFHQIIRACKECGLAVAGADRLELGGELAVRDLTALLSFLATPEDDLSLAAVLRSPLFGWSEGALYRLAAGRPDRTYLWQALRGVDWAGIDTLSVLNDLRDQADFLRPYEILERMLTRHGGRQRLVARLGHEAEDGIDAFLAEALAYERTSVPSLTGFLVWMQSGKVEVKRRPDSDARRIRVMTVHGAKGLEAPIVILPDTGDRRARDQDSILRDRQGVAHWKVAKAEMPAGLADLRSDREARERDESARLLYVAMTRAEQWLIVAAAGEAGAGDKSWYGLIRDGLAAMGAEAHVPQTLGWDYGPGLRFDHLTWPEPAGRQDTATGAASAEPPPAWLAEPALRPDPAPAPLSPSALGGAKALPGEAGQDEAAALRRGTLLHLLLQHLPGRPDADWPTLAAGLLRGAGCDDPAETDTLFAEAHRVLTDPALAHIFGPEALAEVELSARVEALGGQIVGGVIDRLIVAPDRVLAVDFKSNALVPDRPEKVPEGILRQLGAYAAMLEAAYPGRAVEVAVVWTRTASLMPLPINIVRAAMQKPTVP